MSSPLLLFVLLSLVMGQAAGALQMAINASYTWYYNYSIASALINTSRTIPTANKQICAYLCTWTPGCFAVTFNLTTNVCNLMSPNCGQVVLVQANNTVTAAFANFTVLPVIASLVLPLVKSCGGFNTIISKSVSSMGINYVATVSVYERYTLWGAVAPTAFFFSTQINSSPYANTPFIYAIDTSNSWMNMFSSVNNSFSIAFMVFPAGGAQSDYSIMTFTSVSGLNCIAIYQTYESYLFNLNLVYKPDCSGNVQMTSKIPISQPTADVWYHYVAVYDAVAHTFTVYLNGNIAWFNSINLSPISVPVYALYIGNMVTFLNTYAFVGEIYCIQLFKSALPAQNVRKVMQTCQNGGVILL